MKMPETPAPILIADDDPNDLFLVRRRLQKAGIKHPIVTFQDGEELVNFLREANVGNGEKSGPVSSLVFVDIKMPRMDGFDVLRWIRRQRAFKDLPVVVLSGSDEPRDIRRAQELGATHYLVKLPSAEELRRTIERLVSD